MSFKDKLLAKSNQYNYYKDNYEKLLEENKKLKERIKFISNQKEFKIMLEVFVIGIILIIFIETISAIN